MGVENLLARLEARAASGTSGTSRKKQTFQLEPLPPLGGTSGTSGTSKKINAESKSEKRRSWRITYPDRALTITCAPPATLADVQAMYPGASVAPVDPRPRRPATTAEAAELRALLARALPASTAEERAEAEAIGLADIESALICWRAIAKAAKPPPSCDTCAHSSRPGTTVYCGGGREDLPKAYGQHHPLRRLPADGGASCTLWQQHPRRTT